MSTLATSRHPTLNLTLKLNENNQQVPETETETEREPTSSGAMHPDCLPLPLPPNGSHGSSPQLQQADDGDEDEGSACDEHMVNILDDPADEDDDEELEDDAASCCSENSVLSVGQEQSQQVAAAAHARQRLLMSQLYRPSAFSSVSPTVEDPSLPLPHMMAPASFQEEFLRKSQLYAEELMKQQMHLMAAARVNALTAAVMPLGSLRGPKVTQQLQMAAAAAAAAAMRPATGQDALAQLTATALGIGNATHPHQLLMQQQLPHPYQQQHNHTNNNNNNNNNINNNNNNLRDENMHERALKFSIDNILKADFGSRLQQRLQAASGGVAAAAAAVGVAPLKAPRKSTKPLNLAQAQVQVQVQTQPSLSFSSSLANICSNSNDSNSTATSSSTNNPPAIDLVKSPNATSPAPASGASKSGEDQATTGSGTTSGTSSTPIVWPAWVYCTRYSDRPSSGPRTRKPKKPTTSSAAGSAGGNGDKSDPDGNSGCNSVPEDKRPRTAFSGSQLARLKHEFNENRYLTEKRRQQLSGELGLNEAQIKIWFQNKRAKLKKSSGTKNPLALQLMAQGLYNHSTVPLTREEEELQELQEAAAASASAAASGEPS